VNSTKLPNTRPSHSLRGAIQVLLIALFGLLAVPAMAAAAPPAAEQYKDNVPAAEGGSGHGGKSNGNGKGQGKGEEGKGQGKGEEGNKKDETTSGALASLKDESDDDGGLGTLGIILIILGVILAGTLVAAWLRSRRDAGLGEEPDGGPGEGPEAGPPAGP
jgi:hypothetical protein